MGTQVLYNGTFQPGVTVSDTGVAQAGLEEIYIEFSHAGHGGTSAAVA